MQTILLKFHAPLQSWGTDSHFETRQTDLYPSKSAVIGLIAASLGYSRDEDDKIRELSKLSFAVRIDQQGNLLRDYHIAQKYKKDGKFDRTYVSNRYYLEDSIFIIGLSHKDDDFIRQIYEGLKNPYFQPFMGRRSCPVQADFILGLYDKDILRSIKELPWQASKWYKKDNSRSLACYIDSNVDKSLRANPRRDMPVSFSQKQRIHQYRNESYIIIDAKDEDLGATDDYIAKDHDAFLNI